ncbi:MAG: hypothetical protein ACTSQP_23510, partial [Promethearchaeota archaeon]
NSKETYEYIKIRFQEFKKLFYKIPITINPFDERTIIINKLIKNLMIDYYKGGLEGTFDDMINKKIFFLTKILNLFDNSYLPQYIRLPSIKPDYQNLSRLFFGCSIDDLKNKLINNEIHKEKIMRNTFILSGDLALKFQDFDESYSEDKFFYVKKIHRSFYYDIVEGNIFFKETLKFEKFLKALYLLREYGLIELSNEEYKGDSSNTKWKIRDKLRLKEYIKYYSINYLLRIVEENLKK